MSTLSMKSMSSILALVFVVVLFPSRAYPDDFAKRNNEGNALVEQGMLDSALEKYHEAALERPGTPEVEYNIANVYHLKNAFDTAAAEYQDALASATGPIAPQSYYNLGNTLYRMGQYQPAVQAYKRALMENPDDLDAKYNLEIAQHRLQSDSTQQKQQCDNPDQKPDSSGQDQQQNQQQSNQNQDSTSQQQQQNQQQDQKSDSLQAKNQQQSQSDDTQQQAQQQQETQKPVGMTKEDAERILDALKDDELDVQKLRAKRATVPTTAKDW
jgi:Ca-activated chloride channel family protein